VRELRSAVEYAVIGCKGAVIQLGDLPPEIARYRPPPNRSVSTTRESWLERFERTLELTDGNRSAAAQRLGISRATMYRRLRQIARDERHD
jgi:transcriptional regulator of acetoin/glycerol metabolism